MISILFPHKHHYIIFQILIFHYLIVSIYLNVIIFINLHHYMLPIRFQQNMLLKITTNQLIIFKPLYQQNFISHLFTLTLISKIQHNQ